MKKNQNNEGRGLALAGMIISLVAFGAVCLWIIAVFAIFGAAAAAAASGH